MQGERGEVRKAARERRDESTTDCASFCGGMARLWTEESGGESSNIAARSENQFSLHFLKDGVP